MNLPVVTSTRSGYSIPGNLSYSAAKVPIRATIVQGITLRYIGEVFREVRGTMDTQFSMPKDTWQMMGGFNIAGSLEQRFKSLRDLWKKETVFQSRVDRMAMHPAYQQIIGMGPAVVPLILAELKREPDHWFWALHAITGAEPVPTEARGHVSKMVEAWIKWGEEHKLISDVV